MGDGPVGQRLNPYPFNLTDKAKMEEWTEEEMFKAIIKGGHSMPAFANSSSAKRIAGMPSIVFATWPG